MNKDNKDLSEDKYMETIEMREENIDNHKKIIVIKNTQEIMSNNKENTKEVNKELEELEAQTIETTKENNMVRIKAVIMKNKEVRKTTDKDKIEEIVILEEIIDIAKMMIDQ